MGGSHRGLVAEASVAWKGTKDPDAPPWEGEEEKRERRRERRKRR